ncbi:MAG: hypothetical protein JWO38_7070 [Gemmataceae bacterium]|nr:hypothetical protein [Gemmataceae bacterium]
MFTREPCWSRALANRAGGGHAVLPVREGWHLTHTQAEHVGANPGDMPSTEDYTFGWSDSPLVRSHGEKMLTERPAGAITAKRSGRGTVGWISWSLLTLAIGIGLIWAARRMRLRSAPAADGAHAEGDGEVRVSHPPD